METEGLRTANADGAASLLLNNQNNENVIQPGVYSAFAESPLWHLQRKYYEDQGLDAWSEGQVPHYVTSNPFIAKAYAEIALGFWRDLKAKGSTGQPFYIIELGAGCGRFAYHFLLHFCSAFDAIKGPDDKACYVMTDFAAGTVAQWNARLSSKLKPFITQGLLDFAVFDAEADTHILLQHQKITLAPNTLSLPPVVIANYVFSSLRQDLFFLAKDRIFEGWLALSENASEEKFAMDNPFHTLQLDYQKRRVSVLSYPKPLWNQLITSYAKRLPPCALLFPSRALHALDRLTNLHGSNMLLLSGDRSTHELKHLATQHEPEISRHSSFSLPVNYHALMHLIQSDGGTCWINAQNDGLAIFVACCQAADSKTPNAWRETGFAVKQALQGFSPNDYYRVKQSLETEAEYLSPAQMLAFLRLSHWDTKVFYLMFPYIFDMLAQLPSQYQTEWYLGLVEVWRYHLPIGEDYDLAFDLGILAAELNRWSSAIFLFLQSLEHSAQEHNKSVVFYNLAMAHWQMASHTKAESYLEKSLALRAKIREQKQNDDESIPSVSEIATLEAPQNITSGNNLNPDISEVQNRVNEQDLGEGNQDDDAAFVAEINFDAEQENSNESYDEEPEDDEYENDGLEVDPDIEQSDSTVMTPTIIDDLAKLRDWQTQCQTIMGTQVLQPPATTPPNPKALYATLLGPHHAQALYRLQRDPELAELAGVECLRSSEHARGWIQQEQSEHKHALAILHPEFGLIGIAALESPSQAMQPGGSRSGRFYYWIGEEYQWQGYGTQAMRLLHQLAAKNGVLHIFSTVDKANVASQRALAKLGYERLPFKLIGERPGYGYHHFGAPASEDEIYSTLARLLVELGRGTSLAPMEPEVETQY